MASLGSPALRPLRLATKADIDARFEQALADGDGELGAHCIHELWMRGEMAIHVRAAIDRLWASAAESIPDWLPMRHFDWLALAYEVAGRFQCTKRGRSNIYLVLLDYSDSRDEPYGVYVGMTSYAPSQRFDQHKAGIRAAGPVLRASRNSSPKRCAPKDCSCTADIEDRRSKNPDTRNIFLNALRERSRLSARRDPSRRQRTSEHVGAQARSCRRRHVLRRAARERSATRVRCPG
jgi:hypothetical protein